MRRVPSTRAESLRRNILLAVALPIGVASCRGSSEPSTAAGAGGSALVVVPTASDSPRPSAPATTPPPETSVAPSAVATAPASPVGSWAGRGLGTWVDTPPPPPPAAPVGPGPRPLPTCPGGKFCGPASLARAEGTRDPEKLSCPPGLDQKTWAGAPPDDPSTPPRGGRAVFFIDEAATAARRAKHDQATCCYGWSIPCPGGRPLVAEGVVRVAPLARSPSWA